MRALVTGAAGFVGRHLVAQLLASGHEVTALLHPRETRADAPRDWNGRVVELTADLLDDEAVLAAVAESEPDAIYHLAAFANPQDSFRHAERTLSTNVLGARSLLEAARATGRRPRVLLVGSAQQYGNVGESSQPIGEDHPQKPLTPYGVSKAAQELLGQSYFLADELPVYWTRSFNHTGPGQADIYVCSNFARQVVDIERGASEPELKVGNLEARRDFTDVRDVARAYELIVERGEAGRPYNVCRGDAVSIREVLDTLVALSSARVEVRVDPERYHAVDAPLVVGDPARVQADTSWSPSYSLRDTLEDLLNDWRKKA